ncbi:MAG: hypothetical protein HQ490_00285 [Lutibacter sp.]|nr:hypothetical protein [Lutibacter sp.]
MEQYSLEGLVEILNLSKEYHSLASNKQLEIYDKCNWAITRIIQEIVFNDEQKDKPEKFFINISSKELKKYLGTRDYITVINLLISTGIVKRNDKYSKGNFSKSYSFTNKSYRMGDVMVAIHSKAFIKRLSDIKEKAFYEAIKDPLLKKILYNTSKLIVVEEEDYYKSEILNLTEEEMENEIDPEEKLKERKKQYYRYKSFYNEFKALNDVTSPLEVFKNKIYQTPTIAKSGRVYYTVSSIPRYIRKSMRVYGGHYIWEVDMRAAQPTLLMLEWLKSVTEENSLNTSGSEFILCKELILKGGIYDYIKDNSKYFNLLEYSYLKKEILCALYEPNQTSERNKALKSLFPYFIGWLNTIKKKNYKRASHIGQSREADIFVEVYKNLPDDMFSLIIHDSILCLEQDTKQVKELLVKRTTELFPILKTNEDLDKLFNVSIVSIKDEELMQAKNERLLIEYLKKENFINQDTQLID